MGWPRQHFKGLWWHRRQHSFNLVNLGGLGSGSRVWAGPPLSWLSDVQTDKGFNKMAPFWMCRKWSIFFLISSTLLYVTLSSLKEFKKSMTSSLAGNDRRIMVRSSSKLFWNGVPDRIIRFLVQSSARAFRISLFGRPLLKFVPKGELFYSELRSKTTLKSFVASYACYFRLMMKPCISSIL